MQVLLLKHCQHFTNILICPLWQRVRRYSCLVLYLIPGMTLDESFHPSSSPFFHQSGFSRETDPTGRVNECVCVCVCIGRKVPEAQRQREREIGRGWLTDCAGWQVGGRVPSSLGTSGWLRPRPSPDETRPTRSARVRRLCPVS